MTTVPVERKVLSKNDDIAARLRERFAQSGTLVLNLIGSPGAGKTALLERTLAALDSGKRVAVLTGDIQTDADAQRLAQFGFPVRQITTAGACHLDASMIERALEGWSIDELELLFIENVGNLVCPTSYDLGEAAKVVVLSVTEGEEKPLKYPGIFHKAALMLLSKTDLLPYVPFDAAKAVENARTTHPGIDVIRVSATTGEGIGDWIKWVQAAR